MMCFNFNILMIVSIYTVIFIGYLLYLVFRKKPVIVSKKVNGTLPKLLLDIDNNYWKFHRYVNFNEGNPVEIIDNLESFITQAKQEIHAIHEQGANYIAK